MMPPDQVLGTAPQMEMAHVLFMDVVGYSKLPMDEQRKLLGLLQELVRNTPAFADAHSADKLISLPTGDGMALVFFDDPESPVWCAIEVSRALGSAPMIALRMGIHSGPVYRVADINAARNVAGGGINTAQRVMDCGDAGHILVSEKVVDVLTQVSNWKEAFQDLGEVEVKHGARVHIFNLCVEGAGNKRMPRKLAAAQQTAALARSLRLNRRRLSLALVGLGAIVAIFLEIPRHDNLTSNKCELVEHSGEPGSNAAYAQVVASEYCKAGCRRVTMVVLADGVDPARVLNNVCEQRSYIASLIPKLNAAGASVIVIDKFFAPESCEPGDKGTSELISAVQNSSTPIVIGLGSHAPNGDPRNVCLIGSRSLAFGNKHNTQGTITSLPAASFGLIRLNSDIRRIPLSWFSYRDDVAFKDGDEPTDMERETLSWVAATRMDPTLSNDAVLTRLRTSHSHPFTSFINPNNLPRLSALDILCSSSAKQEVESRFHIGCAAHTPSHATIRGRVAVIGEDVAGRDRHTLFGDDVAETAVHLRIP